MKKSIIACVFTGLMLAGTMAWADDESDAQDTTVYEFTDTLVEGLLIRPEGASVSTTKKAQTKSLIKVRKHFVDEMFKSVDNI